MPLIPGQRQSNRISISSPVPIDSTGGARIRGESLAGIGEAVVKTTSILSDVIAKADSAKRTVEREKYKQLLIADMQEVELKTRETSKADGTDLVENFNTGFEERAEARLGEISDKGLRAEVLNEALALKNQANESLIKDSVKQKFTYVYNEHEKNLSRFAVAVSKNPMLVEKSLADYEKITNQLVEQGMFRRDQAASIIKVAQQKLAKTSIRGLAAQGKFDEARLQTEALGHYLDSDKDEAGKMFDTIERMQVEQSSLKYRDEQRRHTLDNQMRQDAERAVSGQLFSELQTADSPDKIREIEAKALNYQKQGLLSPAAYRNIVRVESTKFSRDQSNRIMLNLRAKLLTGDEQAFQEAQDDLAKNMGAMNPADALKAQNFITKLKTAGTPEERKKDAAVLKLISSKVRNGFLPNGEEREYNATMSYYKFREQGMGREEARKKAIMTHLDDVQLPPEIAALKDAKSFAAYKKQLALDAVRIKGQTGPEAEEKKADLARKLRALQIQETLIEVKE